MRKVSKQAGTRSFSRRAACAVALLLTCAGAAAAPDRLEVLHWWTSTSEAAALGEVKAGLQARGYGWEDSSVDGGDDRKRLIAAARAGAGRMPDALQLHGFSLRRGKELFRSLDAQAQRGHWDAVVPAAVSAGAKVDGHWIGVPVGVHRTNWIWANKQIFDTLDLAPPSTFQELMAAAAKIKAAGYLPLAQGREPWQDAMLLDNAVLSAGGPSLYRRALLQGDPQALASAQMRRAFAQLAALRTLVDRDAEGRPWNFATAMVVHGRAAMQVMGDWAKGEFLKEGQKPDVDFLCFPYPGTAGSYVFVTDMFAMPERSPGRVAAQDSFAATLMDPKVQLRFNLLKGSIPPRTDTPLTGFDSCGTRSAADFAAAAKRNTLVIRFASEVNEAMRYAINDSAAAFMNGKESAEAGAQRLAQAMAKAKRMASPD